MVLQAERKTWRGSLQSGAFPKEVAQLQVTKHLLVAMELEVLPLMAHTHLLAEGLMC